MVAFAYVASFDVFKKSAIDQGKHGAEHNVDEACGTNKDDKSGKAESKNEKSAARNTDSAETFDWKLFLRAYHMISS